MYNPYKDENENIKPVIKLASECNDSDKKTSLSILCYEVGEGRKEMRIHLKNSCIVLK